MKGRGRREEREGEGKRDLIKTEIEFTKIRWKGGLEWDSFD